VTLRPGTEHDVASLAAILAEPAVSRWWGAGETREDLAAKLAGESYAVLLVIEVGGAVAGGIEYVEEAEPEYRHAGIDIYLGERFHGDRLGQEAIRLLAGYLFAGRDHHRLTIDPAADNARAIACYERCGFRRVGILRQYELRADGRYHDGLLMDLLRNELVVS
jgi:aminoglycoside 6'-N-acetyltransferase